MADNSAALTRARRQDSRTKRARAVEALASLEQTGERVTFPAVARLARVSVSLLYDDNQLSSHIASARDRQREAGSDRAWRLPARSLVTEQSLRTELANAKERGRRLAEEVSLLRQRLSRHLGSSADVARGEALGPLVDDLEQRTAELEADNQRQRLRIAELETDLREHAETLDAARAVNRELMTQLNRGGAQPETRTRSRAGH